MAFNGSTGSGNGVNSSTVNSGNGGNQDGPLNKRLCTGKENNEAGVNNNRVSVELSKHKYCLPGRIRLLDFHLVKNI